MRLVAGVLALTLFAPFVRAEDTTAPRPAVPGASDVSQGKIPLRVVRVMPESRQALLFDRKRQVHVLAEVGATIDGYTVEDIDGDEVTLRSEGTRIVLAGPARSGRRREDRDARVRSPEARLPEARPVDKTGPAPVDPYGEPAVRAVRAPGAPASAETGGEQPSTALPAGDGGVRVATAPDASTPAPAPALVAADPFPVDAYTDSDVRVATAPDAGTPAPAAAPPVESSPFPVDAYADSEVRVATAPDAGTPAPAPAPVGADPFPVDAYADSEVRIATAPDAGTPSPTAAPPVEPGPFPVDAYADSVADAATRTAGTAAAPATARPAGSTAPAGPAARGPAVARSVVLSRGEVDRALDDFASLAKAIRGSFSAAGVVVEEVSEGSMFSRAGLRAGDVITAIDGAPLRSLDDAANLYARASTAKAITVQIARAGKPIALHVTIR